MTASHIAAALGRHTPKTGGGFMACCPAHDDKNPSLAIDQADDGSLLVKCFAGCPQDAVVNAMKSRGLWADHSTPLPSFIKPVTRQIWRPVLPVPDDVPPPDTTHYHHGEPSGVWRYFSSEGKLLQIVCRFDVEEGKQILPLTWCTDGKRQEWRWKGLPEPRPLYGLELIGGAKHVVVVEGEKATDAARRLLGRLPVVTWSGGSNAVSKTDWSPLAGKNIAVWPDADNPGVKASVAVAKELEMVGVESIKIIEIPEGVEDGWDLADAETEGWESDQIREQLKAGLLPDQFAKKYGLGATDKGFSDVTAREEVRHNLPLLFDDISTPEIPPSLLPGWMGEYAEAVSRSTQTPPAMAVMLILATVATCTAKRYVVSPFGDGYTEPLNLWTATSMPPASRKTAVVSAVTSPLADYEKAETERLSTLIKDAAIKCKLIEKRIDKLERDAGKAEKAIDREVIQREISKLYDEMPLEIKVPRLWTGDCTPEKLQGLLVDYGERMSVLSDEGGIFEVMAGLYSEGRVNLDVFLKGHSGSPVRVDRQGRTAHLDAPALSFGLAIQPSILAEMVTGGKKRFRGNGTLARFLYAVPRSNVGSRDVRKVYQIPDLVSTQYRAGLFELLSMPLQIDHEGNEVPGKLTLSKEALDSWYAFADMIEQQQGPGGDLESISDWSGKLPGAALRIAGNFHLVKHGNNLSPQISANTLAMSLDLCSLLIDHAKAAFAMMEADPVTADAKAMLQWVIDEQLSSFKRGDIWPKFKGRFTGKTDRLDKALQELQRREIVEQSCEYGNGRTATIYLVNPCILGAT